MNKITKKILLSFIAIMLSVSVLRAENWDIYTKSGPRWLSVMPLHENAIDELAADAAALGNDTFVDGIVCYYFQWL